VWDPPQSPTPSPSRGQPTWGDTGTVCVAARVAQVTVHVVDGGAVPVAEGAPARAVAVTLGIGGLGDIYGARSRVTLGPSPAWARCHGPPRGLLRWDVTLVPKPTGGHTQSSPGGTQGMLGIGDPPEPGIGEIPPGGMRGMGGDSPPVRCSGWGGIPSPVGCLGSGTPTRCPGCLVWGGDSHILPGIGEIPPGGMLRMGGGPH